MQGLPANRCELEESFTRVALVKAAGLEQVYEVMQKENWSPRGEARFLMERIGVDHVSMAEGDLVHDMEKDCWYIRTESGFCLKRRKI